MDWKFLIFHDGAMRNRMWSGICPPYAFTSTLQSPLLKIKQTFDLSAKTSSSKIWKLNESLNYSFPFLIVLYPTPYNPSVCLYWVWFLKCAHSQNGLCFIDNAKPRWRFLPNRSLNSFQSSHRVPHLHYLWSLDPRPAYVRHRPRFWYRHCRSYSDPSSALHTWNH